MNGHEIESQATHATHRPGLGSLQLVSVNHRTAPIDVLERVALAPGQVAHLLRVLKGQGIEAVAVATCNRTELYWLPGRDHDVRAVALAMTQVWAEPPAAFHRYALELHGAAAARHLFRVAGGIESLMLGESEILGQLRTAMELAESESASGALLTELFRSALRFGRCARAQTRIGEGAMSVASAAVRMLRRAHSDLSSMTIVVLGAGHTGFKAAQHLRAEGVGRLVLINRTEARAREAAQRLGAECAPIDELESRFATADALVTAVQAPEPVVTAARVRRAMEGRTRPLTIIDLSLPRAVSSDVDGIAGVSYVDLSRLEAAVQASREGREQEIPRVEELLETALEEFETQAAETAARPLVAELRARAEAIRRAEVERAVAGGLGDAEALDHVTRRIVDRLLRAPSTALRQGLALDREPSTCLDCVFGVGVRGRDAGD